MTESNSPPPSHDAIKLLSDLLALVASPAAAKKVVSDLLDASSRHQAVIDAARAEMAKLSDLHAEIENGVAVLREKFDAQLASERDAFDKAHAAREAASLDRERRSTENLKQTEIDRVAAAKVKAKLDEKLKVLAA